MPVGSYTWQKLASSIIALEPTLLEALDLEGNVLRATHGDESDTSSESIPPRGIGVSNTTVHPPTLVDVATLQLVAKLIAEAYKHSNEVAFERLASLFDSVNNRSASLERSLAISERMRVKMAEMGASTDDGEGGELGSLIRSFLAGSVTGSEKTTNGKEH